MSSTLAPFIVRKLAGLGSDPRPADLDALHKLLDTVPEERVVSDEEVQVFKNVEKKTLVYQKTFKKATEDLNERTKFTTRFCMLFSLPVLLSIIISGILPKFEVFGVCIFVLSFWPITLIAVVFLFHLYGFDLDFPFPVPVQYEVLKDEDDDWQDTMTSTELHFRQKALVNGWEQLEPEQLERLDSVVLFLSALLINLGHYSIRLLALHQFFRKNSDLFSSPSLFTEPLAIFFVIEFIFSIFMALLFCAPFWVKVYQIITFKKNL
ncbi:hypothetical protein CAEBREN_06928 [Caenorhabditis brenneri]|uniref:Uncharacterized protein n=1 Tax=Caenorhabditis brenneri TaxID=135651 RepID=G0MBW6_CAEBE|nr:hypothetical protein CAEBREN_06928 [Caenorhabditis brenneri]